MEILFIFKFVLLSFFCNITDALLEQTKVIEMDLVRVKTGRGETRILAEEEIRRNMAGVEMNLYNTYDIRYYAYMYIGDSQRIMSLIFETMNTTTYIPLNNCTDCHTSNKYTPSGSFTTSGSRDSISVYRGTATGVKFTDNIRATYGGTPVSLNMFGSDHEENIGYMYADGVLGMGPQDSSTRGYGLFVEQLYKNSLISNNGFGMNYPHIYNTSKVIFGGYDTTIVTDIA